MAVTGDWTSHSGEVCMQTLLCEFPEIDAVFVFNDQMALGAMQAAQKLGRKIPQTLGVVGYDNIPDSAFYTPPLTTVSQDLFQLGQMAVQELERVIVAGRKGENNMEFKNILLQPELVIRDSSRNSMIKEKEEV
jgi:DNA-binding LacI/PurR family transcriptional regulator